MAAPIDDALANLSDSEQALLAWPKPEHPQPLVISVESRKGGVGKTTAALNLSRLLLQIDYEVLFLDLDITGTDVTLGLRSPFWSQIARSVTSNTEADGSAKDANLLKLFWEHFLVGQSGPAFKRIDEFEVQSTSNTLSMTPEHINVLGSHIYPDDHELDSVADRILRPGVLFDELHSYWLLKFIQELVEAFGIACPGKTIAVVIDNSPGYTGLVPYVDDWLTDLGPTQGRFLTLSSFDAQDVHACSKSIDLIHRTMAKKARASIVAQRFLDNPAETLDFDRSDETEQRFLVRLLRAHETAEVEEAEISPLSDLQYWLTLQEDESHRLLTDARKYQGLILNRVPIPIKDRELAGPLEQLALIAHSEDQQALSQLLLKDGELPSDRMVSYDPYIESQFVWSYLRSEIEHTQRFPVSMELDRIVTASRNRSMDVGYWLFGPSNEPRSWSRLSDLRSLIRDLKGDAEEALQVLDRFELTHISILFRRRSIWLPGGDQARLRAAINRLLARSGMPFGEIDYIESRSDDELNDRRLDFVYDRIRKEAHQFFLTMEVEAPHLYERFLPSLVSAVVLSIGAAWSDSFQVQQFYGPLLGFVTAVETIHWERSRMEKKLQAFGQDLSPYPQFLANERLDSDEAGELIRDRSQLSGLREIPIRDVCRAYDELTTSQARLFDIANDAWFLLDVIISAVQEAEESQSPTLPFVDGSLEAVILEKRLSHEEGRLNLQHNLASAAYMKEFEVALNALLRRWELR